MNLEKVFEKHSDSILKAVHDRDMLDSEMSEPMLTFDQFTAAVADLTPDLSYEDHLKAIRRNMPHPKPTFAEMKEMFDEVYGAGSWDELVTPPLPASVEDAAEQYSRNVTVGQGEKGRQSAKIDWLEGWKARDPELEAVKAERDELVIANNRLKGDKKDYEEMADRFLAIESERDEFESALISAIGTIRIWHGMGMPPDVEVKMWKIYSEGSPEMAVITKPFQNKDNQ